MDIGILLWFQTIREALGPGFEFFAAVLSDVLAYAVAVLPFIWYWCGDKERGRTVILALGISMYLNQFLKVAFCVSRPWVRDSRITPSAEAMESATGCSFPSGHTQMASACYGSIARLTWNTQRKTAVLCLCMPVLTALTRIFLGVHTPQDVLAGIAVGALSILISVYLPAWMKDNLNRRKLCMLAVTVLSAAGAVFALMRQYPSDSAGMIGDAMMNIGVFAGMAAGFLIETRYIHFDTAGSTKEKRIRFLCGAPGIAFFALLHKILPAGILPYPLMSFLRGLLAALYALAFYPWIIRKYREKKQ